MLLIGPLSHMLPTAFIVYGWAKRNIFFFEIEIHRERIEIPPLAWQTVVLTTALVYAKVYLLLHKVADTPFHIQGDDFYI